MHISTKRLELREAEDADVASLSAYQIDPRYLEHYRVAPDAAEIIVKAKKWAMDSPRLNYQFVITLAGESLAIGCGGVRRLGYPTLEAEIGIELNPDFWGVGYASEVIHELVKFSQSIGVAVLHATTARANVRAHRLFLNAGFTQLGLRNAAVLFRRDLATSLNQTPAEQAHGEQRLTRPEFE